MAVITLLSQIIGLTAGFWLIGLGVWVALRPYQALDALAAMGSSPAIHFGEMGARTLIGAAIVGAASASRTPVILAGFGGFLIVSAVMLMLLPRRWHAAYSTWWAARIPATAVRVVAPLSMIGGASLIWSLCPS